MVKGNTVLFIECNKNRNTSVLRNLCFCIKNISESVRELNNLLPIQSLFVIFFDNNFLTYVNLHHSYLIAEFYYFTLLDYELVIWYTYSILSSKLALFSIILHPSKVLISRFLFMKWIINCNFNRIILSHLFSFR